MKTLSPTQARGSSGSSFWEESRGFSLLEVLVALMILSVIVLSGSVASRKFEISTKKASSREQLQNTVRKYIAIPSVLRNSARQAINVNLVACLTVGTPGELDCENGKEYPISLFGPFQGVGGGLGDGAVTGFPDNPFYYKDDGTLCPTGAGTAACPLEVSSTFKAICPFVSPSLIPAVKCDAAVVIEVSYKILQTYPQQSIETGTSATTVEAIFGY